MANELTGKRIAFLVANEGVEQVELTKPWEAVEQAGGTPELLAPRPARRRRSTTSTRATPFPSTRTVGEATAGDYDGLVLPGGVANPDQLRTIPEAVQFISSMFEAGRPVAVICHGPWTVVEADLVRGRTLTSWPSLKTDIRNAGGTWVDEEVQVCTNGPNVLVTSRKPDDLPAFCAAMVRVFQEGAATAAA